MVAEEVVITLSGGGPWGFRLQGGAEHKKPLQVAKVRKRSKACRAGLREGDELVSINEKRCGGLSHAQAMDLIDSCLGTLRMSIKRAPAGFQSVVLLTRAPSPRVDKEYRASLRALSPPSTRPMQASATEIHRRALMSPDGQNGMIWSSDASEVHQRALMSPDGQSGPIRSSVAVRRECLTSPPDSEAYYGETDSDADTIHERQRRQKRRSPNGQLAKLSGRASLEEETSEMSGYESAGQLVTLPGVPRREVVYQPPVTEWASPVENGTEESCASADEQGTANRPGVNEVDSGFQEPANLPPLVPPERAREALLLASGKKLVPMVGPVDNPVEEELTVTYMDKAKQAKLHRGESTQEKQVKEARTKCRTIASLLTDAPNPHSKGVLMFKKRRQRAKRYTLTCFGSVNGDLRQGDAEEEEEEEDGIFLGSESELDEDGFAAALDSTWDSDYLDVLERRTPGSGVAADGGGGESPSLSTASGKGAQLFEQQRKRVEGHAIQAGPVTDPHQTGIPLTEFPTSVRSITGFDVSPMNTVAPVTPITPVMSKNPVTSFSVVSGNCVSSSKGGTVVSPPVLAPMPACAPPLPSAQQPDVPCSSVINRTAQPFAPGFVSHRSATAPVVFQPNTAKKAPSGPTAAKVSAANSEVKRAVSVTSLYIPARLSPYSAPPSVFSPTSSVTTVPFTPPPAPFSPPPTSAAPFSPPATPYSHPSMSVAPSTQHATPYSHSSGPVAPSTQPATPYSHPSGPVAPSTQPATPYSHPSGPVAPSTQHATPYSHPSGPVAPSTQHATPYSHPSGPVAPFSAPNNLLSPPAMHFTQPASIHSPSLPSPFVNSSQPTQKVSFNPYITVATSPSAPVTGATPSTQSYPIASSTDPLASREQRIAVPAARTGLLQEARRRGAKKPMFSLPEEKKTSSPNPELLSLVQNLDERPRAGNEAGFESGPEEDLLNLGAEACNFMQAQRNKPPPPVAPKMHTVSEAPQIPQMGGKGAELFARRQSRMDRYTVDSVAPQQVPLVSPREPRLPSPTPSMPAHWKYSPNIRAPPPISYNPLLSPSCPPLAQRGSKPSEAPRVAKKGGAQKQGIRTLDFVSHQPYQLNTALFCYGGGVSQPLPSQQSPGQPTTGTLTAPKQVPVKAARVYEIKRFSTPTPTSAPTSMVPALIVPRSATTLGEPLWHINEAQSPAVLSPPAPTRVTTVPELPKISTAPIPGPAHIPVPVQMPGSAYVGLQATKQFKSAPELSPLPPSPLRSSMSGSSTGLRVPRPQFNTSRMGIQANVWRPGSMHC